MAARLVVRRSSTLLQARNRKYASLYAERQTRGFSIGKSYGSSGGCDERYGRAFYQIANYAFRGYKMEYFSLASADRLESKEFACFDEHDGYEGEFFLHPLK